MALRCQLPAYRLAEEATTASNQYFHGSEPSLVRTPIGIPASPSRRIGDAIRRIARACVARPPPPV